MPKVSQRGAAEIEQLQPLSRLSNVCWDDLRVFLTCAEAASFREAARILRLSSSTVTRRIERLERVLKLELFYRLPEGGVLTAEGQLIAKNARAMHQSLCDLERSRSSLDITERGEVTVAVTEGLGSFWVMPRLVEFQRRNPKTTINLFCAMESVDVLRLEADLAIQFLRPERPDLIAMKLGRLHVYPFAAPTYLDTYGTPRGYEDMVHHRLVEQIAPQLDTSALARYFRLPSTSTVVGVKTNTSTAHLYAVEKGAGIGVLPTFALALGAPVVPVDIGDGYSLDIWLTYHPEIRKCRHKVVAIDWVRKVFDPTNYPWFKDQFIHPRDLIEAVNDKSAINEGRGYLAANPLQRRLLNRLHN